MKRYTTILFMVILLLTVPLVLSCSKQKTPPLAPAQPSPPAIPHGSPAIPLAPSSTSKDSSITLHPPLATQPQASAHEGTSPTPVDIIPPRRETHAHEITPPDSLTLNRAITSPSHTVTPFPETRMREAEQERRFNQDQHYREQDFRRAFPQQAPPPRDTYKSYEPSRPPRSW